MNCVAMKYFSLFLPLALFVFACAPSRFVRPLPKGQHAISVSAGGPLVELGNLVMPIPFSSVTYGYGYTNKTTFFAGLHSTALLFGVVQTDLGLVYQLSEQKLGIPAFTVTPVMNLALDTWEGHFKAWPEVDANAFWHYNHNRNFLYAGIGNWFELAGRRAHEQRQKVHWVYYPQVGHTFTRDKWNYTLELKYIAPGRSNDNLVAEYKGIAGRGAIGTYLSITRKF